MITALRTAISKDGVKPATGEFELLLAAKALALADIGLGRWSLDAPLGKERTGARLARATLAAGAAGSQLARPAPTATTSIRPNRKPGEAVKRSPKVTPHWRTSMGLRRWVCSRRSGDWAIGGQGLTTEAVHALAAGQPA